MKHLIALGEEHYGWHWIPYPDYRFAAGDHLVPILLNEIHLVAVRCPMAFVQKADGFVLCALQGLARSSNLLVSDAGQWQFDYIPRFYQYSPFYTREKSYGEYALCIDEKCLLQSPERGSSPIFSEDGGLHERLQDIGKGMLENEQGYSESQKIADSLASSGLLTPWNLPELSSVKSDFDVLYRVDEHKLEMLAADQAQALLKNKGLYMAYCQLLSMQRTELLLILQGRLQSNLSLQSRPWQADEIISFDNI